MSIMVGVGRGAQVGVLIRDAEALERMEKVDTLVVDKTGTLTEGRPRVTVVQAASGFEADEVIQALASVERASEHPLAAAVVAEAATRKLAMSPVADFDSPVGQGVRGIVAGKKVVCGSGKFLASENIDVTPMEPAADVVSAEAATVIFVGIDEQLAGLVGIADPVKATTAAAIAALRGAGFASSC